MKELIKNFDFNGKEIRVITNEQNQVFFVAKDVCDLLGYSNSRDAISKHCKKEGVAFCDTPTDSGIQQMTIINEGNLYRLVLKSKKKEAEKFESWVCDEVLPQIRQTGKYEPQQPASALSKMEILEMALQSEKERLRLEEENKKLSPKAEYTDKVLKSDTDYTTNTIAKEFGMTAIALNKALCERGIQYHHDNHYVLYAKYQNKGYTKTRTHQLFDRKTGASHTSIYTVWTEYGRAFLHSIFNNSLSFSRKIVNYQSIN